MTDVLTDEAQPGHLPEMLWQAHRLDEALRKQNPLPGLHRAFPETGVVLATGVASGEQLARLYRLHVDEWRRFPHPMTAAFLPCREQDRMTA